MIAAAVDAVTRPRTRSRCGTGAARWRGRARGPVGHRDVPFSITVDGPAEAAARARHATGGSFLNFLQDPARTHTAYTAADYRRLREVKRAHDPDNVFALGHNIPPAPANRRTNVERIQSSDGTSDRVRSVG